jgi:hypothetical protein
LIQDVLFLSAKRTIRSQSNECDWRVLLGYAGQYIGTEKIQTHIMGSEEQKSKKYTLIHIFSDPPVKKGV